MNKIKFPEFFEENKKAILQILPETIWKEEVAESVSQTTGLPSPTPHGSCQCPGPHASGKHSAGDLKIFVDCPPDKIGIYCWHQSCASSLDLAMQARRVACENQGYRCTSYQKRTKTGDSVEVDQLQEQRREAKKKAENAYLWAQNGLDIRQEITQNSFMKLEELKTSSPVKVKNWTPEMQVLGHLDLLPEDGIIWIGMPNCSGPIFKERFKTRKFWQEWLENNMHQQEKGRIGCFTTPSTFLEGSHSRTISAVSSRHYFVFECDGGLSHDEQASVILYLRDQLNLPISAVVDTGGKSLHAWIKMGDRLTPEHLTTMSTFFCGCLRSHLPLQAQKAVETRYWGGLGGDAAMLVPAQPCRLAGMDRYDLSEGKIIPKGTIQKLLYLNQKA